MRATDASHPIGMIGIAASHHAEKFASSITEQGPVVQSWFSVNPGLKLNPMF